MAAIGKWVAAVAGALRGDATDAVSAAQALADRGEFDQAIASATAGNKRARHATLERNLALWRNKAFWSIDRSQQRAEWPPVFADPFPKNEALPELPAERLDVAHLGGAITHHGGLIVRGLLSSQEANYFVDGINQAMAVRDAAGKQQAAGKEEAGDGCWYSRFPLSHNQRLEETRPWVESGGGLWTVDSPRMLFDLIEMLKHKHLDRLIADYFGERPAISVGKSTLRRVPLTAGTEWHQDGAFLGRDIRTVNLWIALTECGVDAPGLDLIPRRLSHIVQTGTHGTVFDWSVGHELAVQAADGRPIVSPHFKPGDAVFFDQLLLHRTGMRPSMVRERWAIESWFFAPSSYPMEQEPLII
jgi:phytanoyl-CoA dioxygenase PhyH